MNGKREEKFLGDLPLVSFIIPSFNQGDFIERTLLSILKQDYPNTEVVVIDGGSTDQTLEILKRYSDNVRWLSEKDEGYADAVNKGLDLVRGSIVGIQSSDDYYNQHAVREAVELLVRYPKAALVTGKHIRIDSAGKETRRLGGHESRWINIWDFLNYTHIPQQDSTFARKEAIKAIGGLRTEVDYCADVDLWLRLLTRHAGLKADRFWSFRQEHEQQRGVLSIECFARDCGRSIELWMASPELPEELRRAKERITAFKLFWQATYYHHAGNYDLAKITLEQAIKTYPFAYKIGTCQRLCDDLGVKYSKGGLSHLVRKTLSLLVGSSNSKKLMTDNLATKMIELGYEDDSGEDPLWYLK
jgi:glycosyltransferase involved in cell wall biosynthesis